MPFETVGLATLILAKLSRDYYYQWAKLSMQATDDILLTEIPVAPKNPEVIVICALMIAQKVLHDSPYTTTTWSEIGGPTLTSKISTC